LVGLLTRGIGPTQGLYLHGKTTQKNAAEKNIWAYEGGSGGRRPLGRQAQMENKIKLILGKQCGKLWTGCIWLG